MTDRLEIIYRPLDSLIPYARNPRKNDPVVDSMAAGIKEFGFRYPILVKSDGSVVDGHLRIKAAAKLGMTEVPTVCADDMTEAQIKAFRLYVNRIPESVEWDDDLLRLELEELKEMDFDLELTGFDMGEMTRDEDGILTIKEEEIRPFKKTHILLSFSPETLLEVQPFIEKIIAVEGVEYEQSSN